MTRISHMELMAKLADPKTTEAELARYFVVDDEASDAFAPRFRLNSQTVDVGIGSEAAARSALLLNAANGISRQKRYERFSKKIAGGYKGPIIVAEGDSWWQYPLLLKDTIDHLMEPFAIRCLSAAGDLLSKMESDGEYLTALAETGASILLLSGGGNDLLQNGQLYDCLEDFRAGLKPTDYLTPRFDDILRSALADYERILRKVHGEFPRVKVIVHGYDYAIPKNQRWLGKPMKRRGIEDDPLQEAITVDIMDRFNRALRRLTDPMPHVSYVDCRGVVRRNMWHDELHPKDAGYGAVAARIKAEVQRLSKSRGLEPPVFVSGPFGRAADLERAAQALPISDLQVDEAAGVELPRQPLALSLHVGLNEIDPQHYGDKGELFGCENDARAMESLARHQGFETRILLTKDATRAAVIGGISDAAKRLQAGDMFLYTVAAHGSFLPDYNADERASRPGDMQDETTCLYDSQLVDDEISVLWSLFAEGVRIVTVNDTCHSGNPVRATIGGNPLIAAPQAAPDRRPRHLPPAVSIRTARNNEAEYRGRTLSLAGVSERLLNEPLNRQIKATVLGMGACKDEQTAMDGASNGVFTSALLRVWDGGNFTGDYQTLRDRIAVEIGSPEQIPSLDLQLVPDRDSGFVRQSPFSPWPKTKRIAAGDPLAIPATARAVARDAVGSTVEIDEPDDAEAESQGRSRTIWPDRADFDSFIAGLGLRHFSAGELLVLGGSHGNPSSACFGKNGYPPRRLWPNIVKTIRMLDTLRDRLGKSTTITSAYRTPEYNGCIEGAANNSLHMQFMALDFKVAGVEPAAVGNALRWMRDKEDLFKGGIGFYRTFVHVDTRGQSVNFAGKGAKVPSAPTKNPFG